VVFGVKGNYRFKDEDEIILSMRFEPFGLPIVTLLSPLFTCPSSWRRKSICDGGVMLLFMELFYNKKDFRSLRDFGSLWLIAILFNRLMPKSEKGKDIPRLMILGIARRIGSHEKRRHILPDRAVSSQILNRFATVVLEFLQLAGGQIVAVSFHITSLIVEFSIDYKGFLAILDRALRLSTCFGGGQGFEC
jgi:hypothetical protein